MTIFSLHFLIFKKPPTDTEKSLFQDQYVTSWLTSTSKEPQRRRTISTPTKSSSQSSSAAEYIKESFIADNDINKYNVGLSIGSFEKRNGERCLLFILIGRNYVFRVYHNPQCRIKHHKIVMRKTHREVHPSHLWDQQSPFHWFIHSSWKGK